MALTRVGKGALDKGSIKNQTNLGGAAADADEYLIYDSSADELKAIAASNVTPNETLITGKDALGEGAATGDQILIYDTSAGALKKITQQNLLNFPTVTSVSPTNATSGDGTGNYTFVITGSGFTGATASLITSGGANVAFDTSTVDSDTQITGVISKDNASLTNANEPFDVRVTAATGLQSTLENQINIDASPIFSTAAGSLGSTRGFNTTTIVAADPESGGDVTYTLESGSLPPGISLTSTSSGAVLSGTLSSFPSSDTTYTFTIRAKDVNSNTSDRQFTYTVLGPQVTSFTSSGTFSVPGGITTVDVLVVAGGGGGASRGGGGGAGGLIYRPGFPVTPEGTVTVTVGDGGPGSAAGPDGSNTPAGGQGQDSVFGTLTAKGGGGGGGHNDVGENGGSGGGSGRDGGGRPAANQSSATQPNQSGDSGNYGFGNAGGSAPAPGSQDGGGGGGAGGAGATGATDSTPDAPSARRGGVGKQYSISGSAVYYAGGGGSGGTGGKGFGGQGGGGDGGTSNLAAQAATANRGGGGGSQGDGFNGPAGPAAPANGGKGIVIVSY